MNSTIVFDPPPNSLKICNAINALNLHKACSYDDISAAFLHLGNEVLAPFLTAYFEIVLEFVFFSQIFKTAKVIPVFKTGKRNLTNNYPPISLLPSLSKVLEKLIKICLLKFFDKNQILYENQYGFREKYSTLHALLDVTSETYNAIQRNHHTALIFIDLHKAFDTVSHKILLQKLYHYSIRGPAHKLIESYLFSRYQFVSHNSTTASPKAINIGVPQGSILGPLLFLIYINNLPNAIISKPCLFADDTLVLLLLKLLVI